MKIRGELGSYPPSPPAGGTLHPLLGVREELGNTPKPPAGRALHPFFISYTEIAETNNKGLSALCVSAANRSFYRNSVRSSQNFSRVSRRSSYITRLSRSWVSSRTISIS